MKKLAQQFISELDGYELSPALYNSSLFIQCSGWNTDKYFSRFYRSKTSFPVIILANQKNGVLYYPIGKAKASGREVFLRYWKNISTLTRIEKELRTRAKLIDQKYNELSVSFINTKDDKEIISRLKIMKDLVWELNVLAFYAIYFDQELCVEYLRAAKSKISKERLDKVWSRMAEPVSISFEKRRQAYILGLIKAEKDWQELSEKCQYFFANFNSILNIKDTTVMLKKEFGKLNPRQAEIKSDKIKKDQIKFEKRFIKWQARLTPEERKLARYLQKMMEFRDWRKDYFSKLLVCSFRLAEKYFDHHQLDKKYVLFSSIDELFRGEKYFKGLQSELIRRSRGISVLVSYNGTARIEYNYVQNKKIIDKYFVQQEKDAVAIKNKTIAGQTGSPGMAKGRVRIINSLEADRGKFKKGEILVTGMTRPEFVPLMSMASAIITDEGGITCHAAIISRELGIPCVIGTRVATKILHNRDLVEVDADKGVVRIINKKLIK